MCNETGNCILEPIIRVAFLLFEYVLFFYTLYIFIYFVGLWVSPRRQFICHFLYSSHTLFASPFTVAAFFSRLQIKFLSSNTILIFNLWNKFLLQSKMTALFGERQWWWRQGWLQLWRNENFVYRFPSILLNSTQWFMYVISMFRCWWWLKLKAMTVQNCWIYENCEKQKPPSTDDIGDVEKYLRKKDGLLISWWTELHWWNLLNVYAQSV